jgi:hypothetical protein
MRRFWIPAALLGFLISPTPATAETRDDGALDDDRRPAEGLPGGVVSGPDWYVWDEVPGEARRWGAELAEVGAEPEGWRALAERSAARPAVLAPEHEAVLERWVRVAMDGGSEPGLLGLLFCLLPSLDRTCLVSDWALSASESTRCALARALAAPFDAVGVRGVLDHLQRDRSPEVRRLARAAARSRGMRLA